MADFTNEALPSKTYFRIGEVSKYVGVDPHVIRYWESEFPQIAPVKGKGRQRMFRRDDVLLLRKIRNLLYVQRYTIDGARKLLSEGEDNHAAGDAVGLLKKVVQRLQKYRNIGA